MATYIDESSDIPVQAVLRPVFNAAQAVTALHCGCSYATRSVNQSDTSKFKLEDTKSFSFDMLNANASKTVNQAGLGNVTYAQIASMIKKMIDAERALAV